MSGNIAAGAFTAEMFNQKEETPTEDVASGSMVTPKMTNLALEPSNILNNLDTGDDRSTPHDENSEEKQKFSDPFVLNLPPELKDQLINSLKKNDIGHQEMNLKPETPEKSDDDDDSLANNIEGTSKFTDNLVDLKPTLPERNHITDALESNLEMFTALGGIDRASSADSEATSSLSSRLMRSVSNEDDASSQSSSVRSHQRQGSTGISSGPNRNWVQFDEPQRTSRPYVPIQYTGSSIRSSDLTSERSWVTDDRQSDIIESHDSISHDYIRLDSSRSPVPENWVTFEDSLHPVDHPLSCSTQLDPTGTSKPTAQDLASGTRTPDTPTAMPANWIAFEDDEKRSTILRSPLHQSLTGRSTSSQISREISLTSTSEEGTPTRVMPERNIPSRGNPFAEELQKQRDASLFEHPNVGHNRPTSPYNPFISEDEAAAKHVRQNLPLPQNWETFGDDLRVVKTVGNPFQIANTQITQPYQRQEPYPVASSDGGASQGYASSQMSAGSKNNWDNFIASKMQGTKNVGRDLSTVTNTHQPLERRATLLQQSQGAVSAVTSQPFSTHPDTLTGEEFLDEYPLPTVDLELGWNLMLRHPGNKKMVGSRSWKSVYVKITNGNVIQLFQSESSREPFSEIQLQSNYEISVPTLQHFDGMGKIHKLYLFYMSYIEKRKYSTNTPFEKMKKADELIKLGSTSIVELKSFARCVNDSLMSLEVCREHGVQYHSECVVFDVVDRFRALIGTEGTVEKQSTSVSIYCIAFVSGMPDCALGLNDIQRKDLEVTARQDIIPSKTERWIKLEDVSFHHCVDEEAFTDSHLIKFTPLEACKFELMRYKVKSHLDQTLPLMVRVQLAGEGTHLQLRADVIVRGSHEKMLANHNVCCDIMIYMPIPESWVHIFRKKKKFGQSSVKSSTKKSGKIKKGSNSPSLLETSVGTAKYEHAFGGIVWRIPKLPEKHQVGNSNHIFMCHLTMQNSQSIPKTFHHQAQVEFTMPHSTASKSIIRSLAITNERAPEKRVRYSAHYEYSVNIENHYIAIGDDSNTEDPSGCSLQ